MASHAKFVLPILLALLLAHAAHSQSSSLPSCGSFSIQFYGTYVHESGMCYWSGGNLSLTVGSGMPGYAGVEIVGQNGTIYYNKGTNDWCPAYIAELNLPAQDYNITLHSGGGGGSCSSDSSYTVAEFSSSLAPKAPASTVTVRTTVPTSTIQSTVPTSSQSSSTPSSSSSTGGAIGSAIVLVAILAAYLLLLIVKLKGKRTKRRVAFSNVRGSSLQSGLQNNPNYQRLAARNPQLAKLVQSNPRLATAVMNGTAFRKNTGRVIKYYSEPTDTYDGM